MVAPCSSSDDSSSLALTTFYEQRWREGLTQTQIDLGQTGHLHTARKYGAKGQGTIIS